jgi:hypothetical protein
MNNAARNPLPLTNRKTKLSLIHIAKKESGIAEDAFATVRFTGVRADDITARLSIRIASINGRAPEEAGISRIEPMPAGQMATSKNYTIYNGAIRLNSNNRNLGAFTIPAELWGERVTAIADRAFENRGITSLTIPEGVTAIGARAFADNHWTTTRTSNGSSYTDHHGLKKVIIPASVTSIGEEAFYSHWTTSHYNSQTGNWYTNDYWIIEEVTIGANVRLGDNVFGYDFNSYYSSTNQSAGKYTYKDPIFGDSGWDFSPIDAAGQAARQVLNKQEAGKIWYNVGLWTLALGLLFGISAYFLWIAPNE